MESVAEFRSAESVPAAGGTRHLLVGVVAVLLCLGVQMVLSASLTSRPGDRESVFLGRHLTWLLVSAIAAWLASRVSATQLRSLTWPAFWLFFTMLIMVLIPGIG
ncbi:MAG: FtsW/RodA/SpoVE family cell cycle protein, partial [Planctomyces sp.]